MPKITMPDLGGLTEAAGPVGKFYTAYKIGRGFFEGGGFKDPLGGTKGALMSVIPGAKSIFGGGKGGSRGKALMAEVKAGLKAGNKFISDLEGMRGASRQTPVGRNPRNTIESIIGKIREGQGSLSRTLDVGSFRSLLSTTAKLVQGGGRGGGGRASLPLPEKGNVPIQPGTDFPGQGLGVGGDMPTVGFQAGAVGTTKTPAVRASVSARNTDIDKLVRILGG